MLVTCLLRIIHFKNLKNDRVGGQKILNEMSND